MASWSETMRRSVVLVLVLMASVGKALDLRASGDAREVSETFYEDLHAEGRDGYILGGLQELDAEMILQAAEYGAPEAQCALGTMCEEGVGVEKNETAAAEWYLQSAMNGFIGGMYNLATMYWRGRGVARDDAKAALWFREAAAQVCDLDGYCKRHYLARFRWGDREVRVERGEDPRSVERIVDAVSGETVWEDEEGDDALVRILAAAEPYEQDIAEMEKLAYQLVSVRGRMAAFNVDALMPHGEKLTKAMVDFASARAWAGGWYGEHESQEALASTLMSFMMRRGQEDLETEREGLASDPAWQNVLEVLAEGAGKGDGRMAAILGVLHGAGHGVEQDDAIACEFYAIAGSKGVVEGMNNLGACHEHGIGKPRDLKRATELYQKASAALPEAKTNLAALIERGLAGSPADPSKAAALYREAAQEGDGGAMNNLGVLYATGTGVEQSGAEAVKWFRKAAEVPSGVFVLNEKHATDNKDRAGAERDLGEVPGRDSVAEALYNLGLLYESGVGVQVSAQAAARWFALAAEKAVRDSGNAQGLLI